MGSRLIDGWMNGPKVNGLVISRWVVYGGVFHLFVFGNIPSP